VITLRDREKEFFFGSILITTYFIMLNTPTHFEEMGCSQKAQYINRGQIEDSAVPIFIRQKQQIYSAND